MRFCQNDCRHCAGSASNPLSAIVCLHLALLGSSSSRANDRYHPVTRPDGVTGRFGARRDGTTGQPHGGVVTPQFFTRASLPRTVAADSRI